MLEKMKAIEARLAEVERQLSDPAVGIDQTAQAVLGRFTAAVPAAGVGAGVAARQRSAGADGIILALVRSVFVP